mmetsp:Transcript_27362/g.39189  ORF Transcript_27362/g.39189 Transcript_27362/m.39189 type:complete len:86 (+) Transcript_27362:537-794(+)
MIGLGVTRSDFVRLDATTGGEVIFDDMDGFEVDLEVKDEVECASSAEVDLEISDGMLLTAVGLNGAKQSIADGWMACASIDLMTR